MKTPKHTTGGQKKKLSLVKTLADQLRRSISSGELAVGEKLPSEAALTEAHGVSRTVVREAVASLRSDGMVEPRQGAGVFVTSARPMRASPLQYIDTKTLSSVVEVIELRAAVEVEAAALAAARRSRAQEAAIFEALTAMDRAAESGTETGPLDLAFHLAIARATNNPRFEQFLLMLDLDAIPRIRLNGEALIGHDPDYLSLLRAEHERIAEAISARDETEARAAMRAHLDGGFTRYRTMFRNLSHIDHTTY